MKKHLILLLAIVFATNLTSQNGYKRSLNNKLQENIDIDLQGNLIYKNNQGLEATLSKNIFDDRIYSDNQGNEVVYAAKIWDEFYTNTDQHDLLYTLVDFMWDKKNVKEKYEKDIFDNLQYKQNDFKASLSKTIFDEGVYKDSNGNEIKYSKEYWDDIINRFENDELNIFTTCIDRCIDLKGYKEEYKTDIFGYQQYSNNRNQSASLSTDISEKKIYKDSNENKIEYGTDAWNPILQQMGSEREIFIHFIRKYLFQNERRQGLMHWQNNSVQSQGKMNNDIENIDTRPYGIIEKRKNAYQNINTNTFSTTINDNGNRTEITKDAFGTTIRDNKGNRTEITKDAFGTTIRDNKGNRTEITKDAFGTTIKDNKGNRTEITKDAFGTTIKDNKGNRTEITKDAFGTTIKDNKGNRTEITKDAFGTTIKDNKGNRGTIKRDIFNDLNYSDNNGRKAQLKTDIFKKRIYTDSNNNKIEFSEDSWIQLTKDKGEENAFMYLINKYLFK